MSDFDLEAARADIAAVAATDGRVYGIDQLDEVRAAQAAQVRIVDRHAPALLARVDEQAARIAELEAQRGGVDEVFRVDFHAYGAWHQSVIPYTTFDAAMERVRGSQKRYPERGYRIWRVAKSEAVVWASDGSAPAPVGVEAHPSQDAYLVEQQDPLLVDEPYEGWLPATSVQADESVMRDVMRVKRERMPDRPPMRVVRRRLSWTVVAVEESANGEKPPESPQNAVELPRTRDTGGSAA